MEFTMIWTFWDTIIRLRVSPGENVDSSARLVAAFTEPSMDIRSVVEDPMHDLNLLSTLLLIVLSYA